MPLPARLVLLGHPVSQSLSPTFQNAALRAAGIPLAYETLDVSPEALDDALGRLAVEGAAGNATVPHKAAVFARCAEVTPTAARVAAVNTWRVANGTLVGHNTDVDGFDAAARELLGDAPHGQTVAVVGAGGSAAAVLGAVARWSGARVRVWSRSVERAESLARRFAGDSVAVEESLDACVGDATLIVNATPLGLRATDALPVPLERLRRDAAVLDLVYRRDETTLVHAARARGHRAADGLTMLIEQGARSFAWWLGVEPDRAVMWAAVGGRRRATSAISTAR